MSIAHERKKAPQEVRRKLLDCAARISVEQGLSSVTIQAVSDAAGVTKGGLLHHFPGKQELIAAVFDDLLAEFDDWIDEIMAGDPVEYGRFTRAYATTVLDQPPKGPATSWTSLADPASSTALFISMIADAGLRSRWDSWYDERMRRHKHTDADPILQVVRYAADGIWLADGLNANKPKNRKELKSIINAMTQKH